MARKIRNLKQAFGKVLREMRTKMGVSQEDFAHTVGVHRTYVSQLERGLKSPTLDTLAAIAKALNVRAPCGEAGGGQAALTRWQQQIVRPGRIL